MLSKAKFYRMMSGDEINPVLLSIVITGAKRKEAKTIGKLQQQQQK